MVFPQAKRKEKEISFEETTFPVRGGINPFRTRLYIINYSHHFVLMGMYLKEE